MWDGRSRPGFCIAYEDDRAFGVNAVNVERSLTPRDISSAATTAVAARTSKEQWRLGTDRPSRLLLPDSLSHAIAGRPRGCSPWPTATLSPRGPRTGRSPNRKHASIPVEC